MAGFTTGKEASVPISESASFSAGGNAVSYEGGNAGLSASQKASIHPDGSASTPASERASVAAHLKARPPRRRGRPQGPERVALSVRILMELDEQLTAAVETTGRGPQELVEDGLRLLFAQLRGE